MSPRRRSKAKRDWPRNLYERDGYFSWRHPETHEEFGLGRNKAAAFAQAVEANLHVANLQQQPRLVHRLNGEGDRTVDAWNTKYQGLLGKQDYAAVTLKSYKSLGKRMVAMLKPKTPLATVASLQISEVLETVGVTEGKARLAQALRNFMKDSFREARVQGWYTADNPVQDSKLTVSVEVKRSRLSFDVFMQVYERTQLLWLKNAMALALVSAQRREDIAVAEFKDFRDGAWYCEQQSEKSQDPHRIIIPFELRLDVFGMSLADVRAQCLRTGIASRYVIHQTVKRGNSPVGRRIWLDTYSHRFADEIAALKINWAPKTPPTFHEIRSLAERLYSAQGVDTAELTGRKESENDPKWVQVDAKDVNTQALLGHNDAETTAVYHNSRGSEWVRIKVGGSPK